MEPVSLLLAWACVLAILVTGALLLLRWLSTAPPPRLFARARARAAPARVSTFLRCTPGFDGLLSDFCCKGVSSEGEVRGCIAAARPLLSDKGALAEGAVALLLDSLTGFALWSSGHAGFVTAELSLKLLEQAREGEQLEVRAWVKQSPTKPEDERLKEYALLAFELRRPKDSEESESEGELVAHGEQTMVCIASQRQRLYWNLQLLCPPLFEYVWHRDMEKLKSFAQHSAPVSEVRTIRELLSLTRPSGVESGGVAEKSQDTQFDVVVAPRLLNVMGVGHGAATASIMCAAACEHFHEQEAAENHADRAVPVVKEFTLFYVNPVPALQTVTVTANTRAAAAASSGLTEAVPLRLAQVMLRNEKRAVLARGRISVFVPAPLPRHTATARTRMFMPPRFGGFSGGFPRPLYTSPLSQLSCNIGNLQPRISGTDATSGDDSDSGCSQHRDESDADRESSLGDRQEDCSGATNSDGSDEEDPLALSGGDSDNKESDGS